MSNEGGAGVVRANGEAYVRPTTAHQAVLAELRKMVINGELAPGTAIRQDEIAERFNMSRVPVREALKMLEGEGHVTYLPHHGFRVTRLTIAELIEIYDMREWLETGLVRASIPRLGRAELAAMEDAMAKIAKAAAESDMTTVNEQNRRFHFQLFEPSGLHRAVRTVSQLWDSTDPYRQLYFGDRFNAETVNDDHQAILEAAFAHDVSQTVRLLNLHRGDSVAHLRSLLGDGK
ncbi:GntR family transcriptional regulator [Nonomuraea sp. NEAU-A123]|uniref:GntR family transcriptional regulator n=1 Tax=Nonomuraea sp. NEAU-A123 TaxID=2839649 RepID=UPI001BE4099E|nr:GntR family transcriptional regulator [Nonomuraea sp. NEAU-A123]MBT2231907.1 GntR family transcriptional regulator [Nonomuraea sp. NEAU-A123]